MLVTIRPALLRDRDAAKYLGRSASWIRAQRAADVKATREGRQPDGPTWIVIARTAVMYRVSDLDNWIAVNSIERDVVSFSNRGRDATEDVPQ